VEFNYPAAPEAMERVARALGAADAAAGLYDLAASLGAPTTLKDIGMQRDDIPRAAELVAEASGHNPRPAGAAEIQTILEAAYEGQRPHGAGRRESRT
jgi:maleylacetate reductase